MAIERITLPPVPLRTWAKKLKTERAIISAYGTLTSEQQVGLNETVWSGKDWRYAGDELVAPDEELNAVAAIRTDPGCFIWCTLRRVGKSKASLSFTTLPSKDNPFALATLDAALDAADALADELGGGWLRELKSLSELHRMSSRLSQADLGELHAYIAGLPG